MKSLDNMLESFAAESADSGPLLSDFIDSAVNAGFRAHQAFQNLLPVCADAEVQKKWSAWESVTAREEIRLRLQAINQLDEIHESLIPFLIFFFRSSDSLLYQTAARIIGKHLPHHDQLKSFYLDYLQYSNLDPVKQPELNGTRRRRRILIAFTSFSVHHKPGISIIHPETGKEYVFSDQPDFSAVSYHPPKNPLDMSVIMLALSMVLRNNPDQGTVSAAETLLTTPERESGLFTDRNVIRNWGELLKSAAQLSGKRARFLSSFINRIISRAGQSKKFSATLQSLFSLDEIIRYAAHIEHAESVLESVDQDEKSGFELHRFCEIRFNYWRKKETEFETPFTNLADLKNPILYLVSDDAITQNGEYSTEVIASFVNALTSSNYWRLQPVSHRVYLTFFLLDFASNGHHSGDEEIRQIFSPIRPEFSEFTDSESDSAQHHSVLNILLQKLLDLEQTAKGHIPDGRLIQKIDDKDLLIRLIPERSATELLPVLADAFEHRLRLLLAGDSRFNADHYLYKIYLRSPHRSFYRHMVEITSDRIYGKSAEQAIDLAARFNHLYQLSADKPDEIPFQFWKAVDNIRNRIGKESQSEDLLEVLSHFCGEMEGTGIDTLSSSATLHDLINISQQNSRFWLKSGFPSVYASSSSELNARISELSRLIKSEIEKLRPVTLTSIAEAGEATQRIREKLQEGFWLMAPLLGKTEADVFEVLVKKTDSLLSDWIISLNSAGKFWTEVNPKKAATDSQQVWNSVFEMINKEPNPHFQSELLSVFLSTLLRTQDGSGQNSWYRNYQVLSWASNMSVSDQLSEDVKSYWKKTLTEYWIQMLNAAKKENHEARVMQLVYARDFRFIRGDNAVKTELTEVKTWFLERYNLYYANVCNRELNPGGALFSHSLKTAKEFFSHFSYVWIAIIVGVIMMFDFGDPWTELAEIGDAGGVIFTFLLGVGGTYLYVFDTLRKKINFVKDDPFEWASKFGRVAVFLVLTLIFTVLAVLLFYYMFSSTDQVVDGPNAILHILSWTGFALFIGVFFGLIGKGN